jgi:hypothetical protein
LKNIELDVYLMREKDVPRHNYILQGMQLNANALRAGGQEAVRKVLPAQQPCTCLGNDGTMGEWLSELAL